MIVLPNIDDPAINKSLISLKIRFVKMENYERAVTTTPGNMTRSNSSQNWNWSIWDDRLERSLAEVDVLRNRPRLLEVRGLGSIGSSLAELTRLSAFSSATRVASTRSHSIPTSSIIDTAAVSSPAFQHNTESPPGPSRPDPEPWCAYCRRRYPGDERRWRSHKDVAWKTGEYRCAILAKKIREKQKKTDVYCAYCAKASPDKANTHWKKCPITKKITCPLIRSLPPCQKCGDYGDKAHTTGSCPARPDLENPTP